MKKQALLFALLVFGCAAAAQAQTPTPVSGSGPVTLHWEQHTASLPEAQALEYGLYIDQAPRVVVTATCVNAQPDFACSAQVPAMTPGDHVLALTAANVTSVPGTVMESLKSNTLPVRVFLAPSIPKNFRVD